MDLSDLVADREAWRTVVNEAKTHQGLKSQLKKKKKKKKCNGIMTIGRSGKLLPVSTAQSILVSDPVGTNYHIFLSRTFTWLEMGPPFRREEGPDYYGSLPLYWG
jgi:hypothetical protein